MDLKPDDNIACRIYTMNRTNKRHKTNKTLRYYKIMIKEHNNIYHKINNSVNYLNYCNRSINDLVRDNILELCYCKENYNHVNVLKFCKKKKNNNNDFSNNLLLLFGCKRKVLFIYKYIINCLKKKNKKKKINCIYEWSKEHVLILLYLFKLEKYISSFNYNNINGLFFFIIDNRKFLKDFGIYNNYEIFFFLNFINTFVNIHNIYIQMLLKWNNVYKDFLFTYALVKYKHLYFFKKIENYCFHSFYFCYFLNSPVCLKLYSTNNTYNTLYKRKNNSVYVKQEKNCDKIAFTHCNKNDDKKTIKDIASKRSNTEEEVKAKAEVNNVNGKGEKDAFFKEEKTNVHIIINNQKKYTNLERLNTNIRNDNVCGNKELAQIDEHTEKKTEQTSTNFNEFNTNSKFQNNFLNNAYNIFFNEKLKNNLLLNINNIKNSVVKVHDKGKEGCAGSAIAEE
ncbi:hypothetical protein HEP_00452300, partial [Hepatocystis sp. ex Piliocolobus tephrosceles]